MRKRLLFLAALLAAAPLLTHAARAAAQLPATQSGSLPHGGSYLIYRDTTLGIVAIDLWFRAPGAGYANTQPGISRIAATAAAAAPLVSGTSLVGLVRTLGGRLSINVYPDIVGISTVVPASAGRRVVAALSAAYFEPSIDDDALKTAQRDAAVLSIQERYSPDNLVHDRLFAQLFAAGPAHFAPLPDTVSVITKPTLADVKAFAQRAFRSANATMTFAGNANPAWLSAVTAGKPGNADAPVQSQVATSPPEATNATGLVSGEGIAWVGPPIDDPRAATAMDFVADYLFRDGSGVISKSIDPTGDSYISGQFITLNDPGVMLVTIGGTDAAAIKTRVLAAVQKLTQPLDPKTFAAAREHFLFDLASDTQTPREQADNLGWYAAEGNADYAPTGQNSSYWSTAMSLDPAFVASVVKQYLTHPVVVNLRATSTPREPAS
jgi:predicted Zn-dependent peptidase